MLLRRVEIENFRIFYEKNIINFEPVVSDSIYLIHGDNGHGKTTIMDSIFWAFYGKERKHDKLTMPNYLEIINNHAKSEGKYFVRVKVEFEHAEDRYEIERKLCAKKENIIPYRRADFEEELIVKMNGKDVEDYAAMVNNVFPEDIATFFFFDGETISRYAKTYTKNKETVEKALGLPHLKNAREDLKKSIKELEKELRDVQSSPETEMIEKELAEWREMEIKVKREIEENEKMFSECLRRLDELQHRLEEFEELHEIQKRIKELEEFSLELDKEEHGLHASEMIFKEALPYLLLRNEVRDAVKRINEIKEQSIQDMIDQGRIVDQIEFMEDLKASRRCICGNELDKESISKIEKMLQNLKKELEAIEVIDISKYGWTHSDILNALAKCDAVEDELKGIKVIEAKRKYIDENREKIRRALEREYENLRLLTTENVREKEIYDEYTEINTEKAVCMRKREELKDEHRKIKRHISELERQLKHSFSKKTEKSREIINAIDAAKKMHAALSEMIDEFAEEKRRVMEKYASEIFHSITNKPEEFIGLYIDPNNFEVRVRDKDNELVDSRLLSDGERHVVALSFLGGLKEATKEGTLIIDSPFGRLDQTHKSNLISKLNMLGKQVILLVTDEDLKAEEIKKISNVVKRYVLAHDQDIKVSKVREVM